MGMLLKFFVMTILVSVTVASSWRDKGVGFSSVGVYDPIFPKGRFKRHDGIFRLMYLQHRRNNPDGDSQDTPSFVDFMVDLLKQEKDNGETHFREKVNDIWRHSLVRMGASKHTFFSEFRDYV